MSCSGHASRAAELQRSAANNSPVTERTFKHRVTHWILRLIVLITVIDTLLDIHYSPYYYAWFRRHGLADALYYWSSSSVLVFPLLVIVEWIWLWRAEPERSALAIDTLLIIGYVIFWVISVLQAGLVTL
jgi:hypothetical protein